MDKVQKNNCTYCNTPLSETFRLSLGTRCLLQRLVQGGPGGCLKGPGAQKPLPSPFNPSDQTQVVYRVVGSRSNVKKSDSSQQTDNSAFR